MASIASKLISSPMVKATVRRKKADPEMSAMERLAARFHEQNIIANAAKRAADKAREELYAAMKANGVDTFVTKAEAEAGSILIEAKVSSKTRKVIDVEALAKLVDHSTFIKVVSATQKAVVEHCGSDTALRCSREEQGDENVSVTVVK
jgi:hypothetical protein